MFILRDQLYIIAFLVSSIVFVVASFMASQLLSKMYFLYNIMVKYICFHGGKTGITERAEINNVPSSLSVVLLLSNLDLGF